MKIKKEIVDKVLNLNCDDDNNIRRLKKSLMKLPIMKKESYLETDNLEKLIAKIQKRTDAFISYIMLTEVGKKNVYSLMIRNKKGEWLVTISGRTIWEIFAKATFYLFYYMNISKE